LQGLSLTRKASTSYSAAIKNNELLLVLSYQNLEDSNIDLTLPLLH
jgi:hypothetical protein